MSIITFNQAWSDQYDVSSLCNDRRLKTQEAFPPNSYYGSNHVIKAYYDLPDKYSLKFIVPHGLVFDRRLVWDAEVLARLPAILNYSEFRFSAYHSACNKIIVPFASPYVLASRLILQNSTQQPKREGTLYFPVHSIDSVRFNVSIDEEISALRLLPESYAPIRICLYWRDVLTDRRRCFENAGYPVVSAGHIYDPQFIFRLFHLTSCHERIATNEIGSHLAIPLILGMDIVYIDAQYTTQYLFAGAERADISDREFFNFWKKAILGSTQECYSSIRNMFLREVVGAQWLHDGELFARLLDYTEALDNYGIATNPITEARDVIIPTRWQRPFVKFAQTAYRFSRNLISGPRSSR